MVIAAPRSGTAWAANWLTTESSLCLHDPLFEHHLDSWDQILSSRRLGVACTGVALFAEYLRTHTAKKVVLHRDLKEINASLELMGLWPLTAQWQGALEQVEGLHVDWRELLDNPEPIWTHLMDSPFDQARHAILRKFNVQMDFEKVNPNPVTVQRLFASFASLQR